MGVDVLEQAFASTAPLLAVVTEDHLEAPTPCASWTVRDLVNHLVRMPNVFADTLDAGATAAPAPEQDVSPQDLVGVFEAASSRALRAFHAGGGLDRAVTLPFGTVPAAVLSWAAAIDVFTHGWDLASATGAGGELSPALASRLLDAAPQIVPDSVRGADGEAPFGPVVAVDPKASAADRLAAFLGRRPWQPPLSRS